MPRFPLSKSILFLLIALAQGYGYRSVAANLPPARPLVSDERELAHSIQFFAERVRRDPANFKSQNMLSGLYLQRLRETNSLNYLQLASRAANASLAAVPAEVNFGGLALLAQTEQFAHNFVAARDHGRTLVRLDPNRAYAHEILGDALLELGDYDQATKVFQKMTKLGGVTVGSETRRARLAVLNGQPKLAMQAYMHAIRLAYILNAPPPETIAWCYWQLGETAFNSGDYAHAVGFYRSALTVFPDHYRSLAGMGKALAARGDLVAAAGFYQRAIDRVPDPAFIGALGDIRSLQGLPKEAAKQYRLVDAIGRLGQAGGLLYNRQLALFQADHNLKPAAAYANAALEYQHRKDIYGADAVAWTALKAGKTDLARAAMLDALRLHTRDPRLYYHAGMIAHSLGDTQGARRYLRMALALSPQFDPLQVIEARRVLKELSGNH
jgi:tetratricopeptide (TPR) repeat protein